MAIIAQCAPADFDALTGTCTAPFYAEQPGFLELSLADANAILVPAGVLLACAWGWRFLGRQVNRS